MDRGVWRGSSRYRRLTPKVLVDRLVNRNQHLLALRIAEYLKMKVDRILVHWASEKVPSPGSPHNHAHPRPLSLSAVD